MENHAHSGPGEARGVAQNPARQTTELGNRSPSGDRPRQRLPKRSKIQSRGQARREATSARPERLTFRAQGRDFRLSDVAGNMVRATLA